MLKIDYVPRHLRLGTCVDVSDYSFKSYQEVPETIPVVSDDGRVLQSYTRIVSHPSDEVMSKYKVEDFKLEKLINDGVNLKMVNLNRSSVFTIDELENISKSIDNAETFVNQVLQQREEQKRWFSPDLESDGDK